MNAAVPTVKADWRYSDLCFIVAEAQKLLERGDERLSASTRWQPRLALARTASSVHDIELDRSDRMIPCGSEQIEAEYFEEIRLLESLMAKHKVPIADKVPAGTDVLGRKFVEAIGLSGRALHLWDLYAIPWRFKGNKVFVIHSPRDLNGSPIIHEMDKERFVRRQMESMAEAEEKFAQLERHNELLTYALCGLILVLVVTSLLFLSGRNP